MMWHASVMTQHDLKPPVCHYLYSLGLPQTTLVRKTHTHTHTRHTRSLRNPTHSPTHSVLTTYKTLPDGDGNPSGCPVALMDA